MNAPIGIPSVNYHLWKSCNMSCGFCFATFQDIPRRILPKGHLGPDDSLIIVEELARAGFQKINFAGGEPTLCPWLPDLITRAKELGLSTAMVTNGSLLTPTWIDAVTGHLDWVALSIDSLNPDTLRQLGRTTRSGPLGATEYLDMADMLKHRGIRLKINTVVTSFSLDEDLTDFIIEACPERWKLFQVLPVEDQNGSTIGDYVVSDDKFHDYVAMCRRVEEQQITVVPESNDLMRGSYVMVDPAGRFFDNVSGRHTYSRPIIEVGVEEALCDVSTDPEKFLSRDGFYDW